MKDGPQVTSDVVNSKLRLSVEYETVSDLFILYRNILMLMI